ncbi:hypothetical protein [Pseudaminobacter sp. NGMCC 1.201702]|uniref:hypothetical protein n=1 Tax=Pseudaminobacter sp. NGMCC 1.201702 TaxID=3391825 RepID=UPI0039F0204C
MPSRDFHTSLGPLSFYLPAFGYWLSGSFGGAVPAAMALLLVLLSPVVAHVLTSRLRPFLALPFAAFLLLILAVPMNLGEPVTALSFAMFYNRIGWVAIAVLLVMYLVPSRPRSTQFALDTACAALLTLLMLYTRITYGLVALGFLLFMLTDARQYRWAGLALVLVLAAAAIVELFWRGSAEFGRDVLMAAEAGGLLRGSWGQLVESFLANLADYLLLGVIAALAFRRGLGMRDVLFLTFCMVAGFWLLNQNVQRWGIISIHAAAVVAAERALRRLECSPRSNQGDWINEQGFKLFFLALVLPTMVHCAIALGLHSAVAAGGGGRPVPLPRMDTVGLVNLWTDRDYRTANWYLGTLQGGVDLLSKIEPRPERAVVLGGANPFAAALDMTPPRGDMPELLWRATIDEAHYVPPQILLADVEFVLERLSGGKGGPAAELYLPYVARNFRRVGETEHWRIHRRDVESAEQNGAASQPVAAENSRR